jgi:hypothetical protein
MDPIKEAFGRIKQEIYNLQKELTELKQEMKVIIQNKVESSSQTTPTNQHLFQSQTYQQTHQQTTPTDTPTQNMPTEPLKTQNYTFSTGSEGVPTNTQTHKHTLQQTEKSPILTQNRDLNEDLTANAFDEAANVIQSLSALKGEIKRKFQSLTPQEMLVFSNIYTLQDENKQITYKTIANQLNLSESSIRDYVNRLIKKDVPIIKEKINNKLVLLSISSSLRKNLSLSSIISLRSL